MPDSPLSPLFIVSGGEGASGEQLVRTALAQFGEPGVEVHIVPHVRRKNQVEKAVAQVAAAGGTIIHTLVNAGLRRALIHLARERHVVAIDPMGPILSQLARILRREPLGRPGLYRQLNEEYFERVAAIEFAVRHDDGRNLQELHLAEIVLIGVSRVGKTPLSMYLSMMGWKVANLPLLQDASPPAELFEIDPCRVVGLKIDLEPLMAHRQVRSQRLGVAKKTAYTTVPELDKEIAAAHRLCRRYHFALVDVTDKPIEESAHEVIALVGRRVEEGALTSGGG